MFGQSTPGFWLGLMLLLIFAAWLRWLPTSGFEGPEYVILPALTAGLYQTARLTRVIRSAMLEVLGSDYIRTARSKGLRELIVVNRHAPQERLHPRRNDYRPGIWKPAGRHCGYRNGLCLAGAGFLYGGRD